MQKLQSGEFAEFKVYRMTYICDLRCIKKFLRLSTMKCERLFAEHVLPCLDGSECESVVI